VCFHAEYCSIISAVCCIIFFHCFYVYLYCSHCYCRSHIWLLLYITV
jgi:hypothetical protein